MWLVCKFSLLQVWDLQNADQEGIIEKHNFKNTNDDEDCAIGKKWFRVIYMNLQLHIMNNEIKTVDF